MTSRVSFVKLCIENLKHHLTSLLVVVFAFLIHFISVFMQVQNMMGYDFPLLELQQELVGLYQPGSANGLFALFIGVFLAFDFFRYLHSRKETDFYESLPILKSRRFMMHFVCSIGIFLIASTVTCAFELLLLTVLQINSAAIITASLLNLACMIGVFLASWVCAVLAIVMTGNLIVALLGYGAFSVYIPVILNQLFPTFADIYFQTYDNMPFWGDYSIDTLSYFFSPASLMYKLNNVWGREWLLKDQIIYFIGIWIFALIIGLIAYFLYLKRPSEAAGRAMAFESCNDIIRILTVIPLSLYVGLFLREMSSAGQELWMIFGILFGGFIIHGLTEAIFQFDIKALFTKKLQLLLSYGCCLIFLSIFWFDLLQFDQFLPKEAQIEKVFINTNAMNNNWNQEDKNGISGENIPLILDLAEELIVFNTNGLENNDSNHEVINISYVMKNGLIREREYLFDTANIPPALDQLALTKEFKSDFSELDTLDLSSYDYLSVYTGGYYSTQNSITIDSIDANELVNIYLKEYEKLTFTDYYSYPIVCEITAEKQLGEYGPYHYCSFQVNQSFTNTIAFLKEHGMIPFNEDPDISIKEMKVYDMEKYGEDGVISDEKILSQLKPYIYLVDMNYHLNNAKYLTVSMTIENETGTYYYDGYIDHEILDSIVY